MMVQWTSVSSFKVSRGADSEINVDLSTLKKCLVRQWTLHMRVVNLVNHIVELKTVHLWSKETSEFNSSIHLFTEKGLVVNSLTQKEGVQEEINAHSFTGCVIITYKAKRPTVLKCLAASKKLSWKKRRITLLK